MATLKIVFSDFLEFLDDYEEGLFGKQRLGQAFLNKFLPDYEIPNQFDPALFLEYDYLFAKTTIINKYVEM